MRTAGDFFLKRQTQLFVPRYQFHQELVIGIFVKDINW